MFVFRCQGVGARVLVLGLRVSVQDLGMLENRMGLGETGFTDDIYIYRGDGTILVFQDSSHNRGPDHISTHGQALPSGHGNAAEGGIHSCAGRWGSCVRPDCNLIRPGPRSAWTFPWTLSRVRMALLFPQQSCVEHAAISTSSFAGLQNRRLPLLALFLRYSEQHELCMVHGRPRQLSRFSSSDHLLP